MHSTWKAKMQYGEQNLYYSMYDMFALEISRRDFPISIVFPNGLCTCLEWRWGQNTPKHNVQSKE